MVKNFFGKFLCALFRHVRTQPVRIKSHFVHSHKADRREMIVESSEISLGVRIKTLVKKLGDNTSLDLKTSCGNIHKSVETLVELVLVS
ncbi:MAG: hypothetical protein BWY61_01276 [Firmicutes bacterium ADurb.Bin354]|nr:MAG: hypothetical protein BWY61_01276 [Firmicutes bacterium ADurb.Bin354]